MSSVLLCTSALVTACRDAAWTGVSRDVSSDHGSHEVAQPEAPSEPARASTALAESDPAGTGPARADGECRAFTDAVLDLEGFADDFFTPAPDVALTWRPASAGLYVATLTSSGDEAQLFLLHGTCEGTEIGPIAGIDHAWPGFSFAADPEQEYTFVIEGGEVTRTVQLSIRLGCEHVDDAHCVRAGAGGDPECGMRFAAEDSDDTDSCEAMHAPGVADERCPDTTFLGQDVQGCCKPSGECGHLDPELGCHDLAQADWAYSPPLVFYCDERAQPDPPAYFACSYESCGRDLDCCADPLYGNASCVEGRCALADD